MDNIEWENGIIAMPTNADVVASLDQVGKEGWEAWAILGIDPATQQLRVAVKRHKRKITIATEMPVNNRLIND